MLIHAANSLASLCQTVFPLAPQRTMPVTPGGHATLLPPCSATYRLRIETREQSPASFPLPLPTEFLTQEPVYVNSKQCVHTVGTRVGLECAHTACAHMPYTCGIPQARVYYQAKGPEAKASVCGT